MFTTFPFLRNYLGLQALNALTTSSLLRSKDEGSLLRIDKESSDGPRLIPGETSRIPFSAQLLTTNKEGDDLILALKAKPNTLMPYSKDNPFEGQAFSLEVNSSESNPTPASSKVSLKTVSEDLKPINRWHKRNQSFLDNCPHFEI